MTVPAEDGLLRDLARLLAKYPAAEWQRLVSALQDDSRREEIIASIQALMPLAKPKAEAKRGGDIQAGRRRRLKELENTEPEKYRVLAGLRQEIQSGKLLPSASAVREFAEACGIREALPRNRVQAMNTLLLHLAARPVEEIERVLKQNASALTKKRDFGAEYERWVDLILHRRITGPEQKEAPAEVRKPSPALQLHRQRRGEAVAAAGLNDAPTYALTAAPIHLVVLPALFRDRVEPLVRLLENPPRLRDGGFDLHVGEPPRIVRGQLRRAVTPGRLLLECWEDGTLIFVAEAHDFLGAQRRPGAPIRINPLALAESTYLFAELVRLVYDQAKPRPDGVEFSLTLYRMERVGALPGLTPGEIRTRAFEFGMDLRRAPEADAEFLERVERDWTAGAGAYRLMRRVYTWFGFDEGAIPYVVEVGGVREISPDKIRADGRG